MIGGRVRLGTYSNDGHPRGAWGTRRCIGTAVADVRDRRAMGEEATSGPAW
jgi:hypothetical protein